MLRAVCLSLAIGLTAVVGTVRADGPREEFEPFAVEVARPPADNRASSALETMRTWRDRLAADGLSVGRCGVNVRAGTLTVDIRRPDELARLTKAGFVVLRRFDPAPLGGEARTDPQYFDPGEIAALLSQTAIDHPAITNVFSIGTTIEGRAIWAIEISNNPGADEDEPAIQFNAQHHAREVATSHVVVDVIETLTNGYGSDPDITAWVNDYKTVCVPMVNPDGVQYVFDVFSFWRKNRMPCTGDIGTDLNRNYAYLWGPGCGSSGSCWSDIYRGPSAASELETQAMVSLADAYHFVMATSYHSYGRFIDYPYACSDGSPSGQMPEHDVIHEMMNGMADAIDSFDAVPRYDVFSPAALGGVNGDDTSWYYAHLGAYPFIVEVGTSFEPPFGQVAGIVGRNREGWKYLYDRLGQARIDVHVTADCQPLVAEVTLTDYVFDTGELARETFLPFGRWSFVVPAGDTYTVRVTKPGYVTQDIPVAVANVPVSVDVTLVLMTPPPSPLLGDMDASCLVDGLDIDEFVTAFVDGEGADPILVQRGDFNGDCLVDENDVGPFVGALLNGDACP